MKKGRSSEMYGTFMDSVLTMKSRPMLFHFLSDEDIKRACTFFSIVSYPAGTILYAEGSSADFMGFIVSGVLEVKKGTDFGERQIVIATLKQGSCFGEMALIGADARRFATVAVLEDCEIAVLKRGAMDELADRYPETGMKIFKGLVNVLAIRLRRAIDRLTSVF